MNKNKSKAAYTNKWLNSHKAFWHEKTKFGVKIIVLDKDDAPKAVKERVEEINFRRKEKIIPEFICNEKDMDKARLLKIYKSRKINKKSRKSQKIYENNGKIYKTEDYYDKD